MKKCKLKRAKTTNHEVKQQNASYNGKTALGLESFQALEALRAWSLFGLEALWAWRPSGLQFEFNAQAL